MATSTTKANKPKPAALTPLSAKQGNKIINAQNAAAKKNPLKGYSKAEKEFIRGLGNPVDDSYAEGDYYDDGGYSDDGGGGGGEPAYDPTADLMRVEALFGRARQGISTANEQLMARFLELRQTQEKAFAQTRATISSDLDATRNMYNQNAGGLSEVDAARLNEQSNRQQTLNTELGASQQRSFADRESASAMINAGALGTLEQQRASLVSEIMTAAAGGSGGGGGGGGGGSDQLTAGDATNAAYASGLGIEPPTTLYSGPRQGFVNKLTSPLRNGQYGDPDVLDPADIEAIGPRFAKMKRQLQKRTGKKKPGGLKRVEKQVVDPLRKYAKQLAKQRTKQQLSSGALQQRGY